MFKPFRELLILNDVILHHAGHSVNIVAEGNI